MGKWAVPRWESAGTGARFLAILGHSTVPPYLLFRYPLVAARSLGTGSLYGRGSVSTCKHAAATMSRASASEFSFFYHPGGLRKDRAVGSGAFQNGNPGLSEDTHFLGDFRQDF